MSNLDRKVSLAASLAAAALLAGPPAWAQTVSGGTSGTAGGDGDVSASTYGSGQQTTTPDGSSIGVQGGGEATAADGGSAATRSDAKLNERRAMQRSVATARDEDERARSRTRTVVREGEVRSRTMSRYKEKGERPERDMTYSVTTPEGTTTTTT
jgi:hypothetical protein